MDEAEPSYQAFSTLLTRVRVAEESGSCKKLFLEITKMIQKNPNLFVNNKALMQELISEINNAFTKYEKKDFELYKGLIFLSNLVLTLETESGIFHKAFLV